MGQSTVSIRRRSLPLESDLSLPNGLSQRNGVWQLRIGVPSDLSHLHSSVDAYRGSLRTRDRSEAVTKSHALIAQYRRTFDEQRAAEAVRRAPPVVPLTSDLAGYLERATSWLLLAFDDVVRFTPGATESLTPRIRFLTTDEPEPLLTGDDPAKWNRLQKAFLAEAKAEIAAGRLDRAERAANASLAALGIRVDWSTPDARSTLIRIARAQIRAAMHAVARGEGEPHDTPTKPTAPQSIAPTQQSSAVTGHTLTDVFAKWQVSKKRDAIAKTTRALALLDAAGIKGPIGSLNRHDGLRFREHINTALAAASGKTRSDVLSTVQALLNFAVKDLGWINTNPWAGTAIPKGRAKKRAAWDSGALAVLLSTPPVPDRRIDGVAQYWLPLLAVLTGARQAELCNLRTQDIIERDGVWLFDINEEMGSVKSAAGIRQVAVHSKLIALGFLEHVERMRGGGESLVFPGILSTASRPASVYVSDWFRDRCKALGIYQRYRDFHALRTTVGTALRAVEPAIGEALITTVMGHEAGNVGAANYHAPAPATLQRVIECLSLPAVMALPKVSLSA